MQIRTKMGTIIITLIGLVLIIWGIANITIDKDKSIGDIKPKKSTNIKFFENLKNTFAMKFALPGMYKGKTSQEIVKDIEHMELLYHRFAKIYSQLVDARLSTRANLADLIVATEMMIERSNELEYVIQNLVKHLTPDGEIDLFGDPMQPMVDAIYLTGRFELQKEYKDILAKLNFGLAFGYMEDMPALKIY